MKATKMILNEIILDHIILAPVVRNLSLKYFVMSMCLINVFDSFLFNEYTSVYSSIIIHMPYYLSTMVIISLALYPNKEHRGYLLSPIIWFLFHQIRWNENVVILTKFSSLAALEVVILTTYSAASDENFMKMKTFPLQC